MNFVALLRAVNVGGTGKLAMTDLKSLCEAAGCAAVRTYIASGNVVFRHTGPESMIKASIEARLLAIAGQRIGVLVRSAAEMKAVLDSNPFPAMQRNRIGVLFLDEPASAAMIDQARGIGDGEALERGRREIYIHYPGGMGASKLQLPAASRGTIRNMNTVAKLAELASIS